MRADDSVFKCEALRVIEDVFVTYVGRSKQVRPQMQ
jgi:hypothetical protein